MRGTGRSELAKIVRVANHLRTARRSPGRRGARTRLRSARHVTCSLPGMDVIRNQLAADHRVLDDLMRRLVHDVDAASHHHLQEVWCELEHRLLSHMDVEEQFLLPLLALSYPAEVERARAEHVHIRGLVCSLGLAIESRSVTEPAIKELVQLLSAHSEREDRVLYRHAAERSSVAVQHRVAATLRASARCAHEAAVRTSANRSDPHSDQPGHG